ncbi:Alcohol acetyltransferase [Carnobacterium alterfunditum]|uniref:Alcohol acetyltransferase n=1 Tax=Carnobacterium alterfunditum TaxID=28230 RepID=A0A1N6EIZ6_9LACT|nr:alcohol acetyltransferase [Carnobacterium alterfunditum]SIN83016.1 Alcohol acetyltransferase [Carnobacterium alterfunditum]
MKRKNWVRLDNASNIFLASMTDFDTKVFRLSATMEEAIDPILLQLALDKNFEAYPLYHSVLRRGVFWYYLEESDLKPQVLLDEQPPCSQLYHFDRKELLFRVVYYQNRIHLEVFHALSDGTGAMWFFEDLLSEYVLLQNDFISAETNKESSQSERAIEGAHTDSFIHHFRHKGQRTYAEAAQSSIRKLTGASKTAGKFALEYGKKAMRYEMTNQENKKKRKKVYQIKGKRTIDNRTHVVELNMSVQPVLKLAHEQNASLTIYLTALFIEAIQKTNPVVEDGMTIAVSVPVNLRKFYDSTSARNFFSTTHLEYTYEPSEETNLAVICKTLKEQLQQQLSPNSLETRLNKLIAYEFNPITRVIFRPVKDGILKVINYFNNRGLTFAMSNLGSVQLPQSIDDKVHQFYFQTSAVRPQFCVISHQDYLSICLNSPFVETTLYKQFVRDLTALGVPITISANRIDGLELRGEEE